MSNYIQQGKILVSQKEYTKALEYFQAAIQNDSTCSEAYLLLSDCYYYLGRIQQSQSTLYSLLSKDPNNQKANKRLNIIQTAITEQSSSHTNQLLTNILQYIRVNLSHLKKISNQQVYGNGRLVI